MNRQITEMMELRQYKNKNIKIKIISRLVEINKLLENYKIEIYNNTRNILCVRLHLFKINRKDYLKQYNNRNLKLWWLNNE